MKLILSLAALAALSNPAYALTLDQAMNELAGMYCSGSSCTSETDVTNTRQLPDIIINGAPTNLNTAGGATNCFTGSILGGPFEDGERCSPAYTLAPGGSGRTIAGGTFTEAGCVTVTKTLSYNGPNTSRDTAWSVSTSSSETAGGC